MPEMSVVRFTESDVIVASGTRYIPTRVYIKNWNDGKRYTGTVTYEDGTSTTYSYQNNNIDETFLFFSDYASHGFGTELGRTRFSDMTYHEGNDPYVAGVGPDDGYYNWNADQNTFEFDHQ